LFDHGSRSSQRSSSGDGQDRAVGPPQLPAGDFEVTPTSPVESNADLEHSSLPKRPLVAKPQGYTERSMLPPKSFIKKMRHPLLGSSLTNVRDTLAQYGGVMPSAIPAWLGIHASAVARSPFTRLEDAITKRRIDATQITEPPLFIIGHWRSGTTHLHQILCQDPQLGYLSLQDAVFPHNTLVNAPVLDSLFSLFAIRTRPSDNVRLWHGAPSEDSLALANMTPCSPYHMFYFPQAMERIFERSVLLEGDDNPRQQWQTQFIRLVRRTTLRNHRKPLVLKDPAHTGHLADILDAFPNARFVFLHRDPCEIFASTRILYHSMWRYFALQKPPAERLDDHVIATYKQIHKRYLADKHRIRPGNLVEIPYSQLMADPHETAKQIYDELSLPGWDQAQNRISRYIAGQRGFELNQYTISRQDAQRVRREWQIGFDNWGPQTN